MPVLLLKHVNCFKVAKEALLIPRIARIMDLFVGPFVGEEDLSGFSPDICECVQDVPGAESQSLAVYWRQGSRLT